MKFQDNPILCKAYYLGVDISKAVINIQKTNKEFVLTRQLLKSITSIGANMFEAQGAQTRKDFLLKVSIAYKEALESQYWIHLLTDLEYIDTPTSEKYQLRCSEVIKILNRIKTTTRSRLT